MLDILFIRFSGPSISTLGNSYSGVFEFTDDLSLNQRGLRLLVQLVIKVMMQTYGTDTVSPYLGGGLMQLVALGPADDEASAVKMNIALAIRAVKDQVLKLQWGKTYPLDETLENLELERSGGIVFDPDTKRWKIAMVLRSAAGESAQFGLGVPGLGNTDTARTIVVGV